MRRSMLFEGVVVAPLILLSFTLLAMITNGSLNGSSTESVTLDTIFPNYMYTGKDDTLYLFTGNKIQAIDHNGKQMWSIDIPRQWRIYYRSYSPNKQLSP